MTMLEKVLSGLEKAIFGGEDDDNTVIGANTHETPAIHRSERMEQRLSELDRRLALLK